MLTTTRLLIHSRRANLPLGGSLLGSLSTPLSSGGSGTGGVPVAVASLDGVTPLTTSGSTGETGSRGSLPVTTSGGEAGLNSGNTLLINTGELLLLELLLSLSLGVAVWTYISKS